MESVLSKARLSAQHVYDSIRIKVSSLISVLQGQTLNNDVADVLFANEITVKNLSFASS